MHGQNHIKFDINVLSATTHPSILNFKLILILLHLLYLTLKLSSSFKTCHIRWWFSCDEHIYK